VASDLSRPLHFAAIPETEISQACERFNLPLETWRRQESAFGLLKKVYARRAQLRGQQPLNATSSFHAARVADGEEKNAAPTGDDKSATPASQPDPVYQRMQSIGKGESLSVGKTGSSPEENEFFNGLREGLPSCNQECNRLRQVLQPSTRCRDPRLR
jgi:hypothetical protein